MAKYSNSEMISDGAEVMARQFCRGNFPISNLRVGVKFFVGVNSPPWDVSWEIFTASYSSDVSLLRITLGIFFPGRFPGIG